MKFTISWLIFLTLILVTITAWIGFDFYHKKADTDIPQQLIDQSTDTLQNSFDKETLKKLYTGKDNFYEVQLTPSPAAQ